MLKCTDLRYSPTLLIDTPKRIHPITKNLGFTETIQSLDRDQIHTVYDEVSYALKMNLENGPIIGFHKEMPELFLYQQ